MAKKEIIEEVKAEAEAPLPKNANQEADQTEAQSGYVWGLSLNHYEQRNEADLKAENFSDSDIQRIKRVMKLAGKSLATESFYEKREKELAKEKAPLPEG